MEISLEQQHLTLKKISIMFLHETYNDNIRWESEIYMKLTWFECKIYGFSHCAKWEVCVDVNDASLGNLAYLSITFVLLNICS